MTAGEDRSIDHNWKFDGKIQLSEASINAVRGLGFVHPTPVQRAAIPLFLSHKDVVVEAVTGSGKTMAFLLPLLDILDKRNPPLKSHQLGAIIIAPTRELAKQTFEVLQTLQNCRNKVQLLVGGTRDAENDLALIKQVGCNILVATPGRLLDILERAPLFPNHIEVKSLEVLVLDEADRLLDLGFERTLSSILEKLPKQRRTGLFSATMSDAVSQLIKVGLRNPVKVTVRVESMEGKVREELALPSLLRSYYQLIEYNQRIPWILQYLEKKFSQKSLTKVIIFFGTCASVEYFFRTLPLSSMWPGKKHNIQLFGLHGRMEQKKRLKVHSDYIKNNGSAILLCTDVAARGLDFQDVDLVIQYEAPQDPTTYVHRAGRTARSGKPGESVLMLSDNEATYIDFLRNRKIPLENCPDHINLDEIDSDTCSNEFRSVNSSDRDFLDKSVRAFVAFIRFYQEHHAKFIFRLKDLNIGGVAQSFGLLKLPKMIELRGIRITNFKEATDVDIRKIEYKNANRNNQRLQSFETLKKIKAESKDPSRPISISKRVRDPLERHLTKGFASQEKTFNNEVDLDELDADWKDFKQSKRHK